MLFLSLLAEILPGERFQSMRIKQQLLSKENQPDCQQLSQHQEGIVTLCELQQSAINRKPIIAIVHSH